MNLHGVDGAASLVSLSEKSVPTPATAPSTQSASNQLPQLAARIQQG